MLKNAASKILSRQHFYEFGIQKLGQKFSNIPM